MVKSLFIASVALVLLPCFATAQGISISQRERLTALPYRSVVGPQLTKSQLAAISDTMFTEGNPNYIWVDLYKDGYITDETVCTQRTSLLIYTTGSGTEGQVFIADSASKAYAEKWSTFIQHICEPPSPSNLYQFNDNSISSKYFTDPQSAFRKNAKSILHTLGLTSKGELRLFKELISDGITTPDKLTVLNFSKDRFFVNDIELTQQHREKYMAILLEEFGHNFYTDRSNMNISSANSFSQEIEVLQARLKAADIEK
jgi:hypothetical protein